jgi:hypothetical protein
MGTHRQNYINWKRPYLLKNMVGAPGFEPGTNGLKGQCSTAELYPHRDFLLGRTTGGNITLTNLNDKPDLMLTDGSVSDPAVLPLKTLPVGGGRHRSARMQHPEHRHCSMRQSD